MPRVALYAVIALALGAQLACGSGASPGSGDAIASGSAVQDAVAAAEVAQAADAAASADTAAGAEVASDGEGADLDANEGAAGEDGGADADGAEVEVEVEVEVDAGAAAGTDAADAAVDGAVAADSVDAAPADGAAAAADGQDAQNPGSADGEDALDIGSADGKDAQDLGSADGEDALDTGLADVDAAATDAGDAAADGVTAPCAATAELCDGLDNDCDGATDEDFALKWPQTPPIPVGAPCKAPKCQGMVVCQSPVQAVCSGCPPGFDVSVQLAPAGAKASPVQVSGGFVEVTAALPLSLLEIDPGGPLKIPVGSSAVVVDADGDGDQDIAWIDGMQRVLLLTRTGPWQYTAQLIWSGKADSSSTLTALTATDADRDGIPEFVAGGGVLVRLVRQSNGSYAENAKEVQLKLASGQVAVQHLLAADLDGDGNQDLLAGLFHCGSTQPGLAAWLWREGGGYWEAAQSLGLKTKGSVWTCMHSDIDGDGRLDVVVLTESCDPVGGVTILRRQPPGIFGSPYQPLGLPPLFTTNSYQAGSPMGGSQADVNGDGVLDYYFSDIALQDYAAAGGQIDPLDINDPLLLTQVSNTFYLSQPGGKLKVAGLQAGLWAPLSVSKQAMVGWAALWDDLDRDGHLDLVTANGYEYASWLLADAGGMRPLIWRNNGLQQFADMSQAWGLPTQHATRNLVLADLDADGDSDLVLGGQAVAPRVYRNDLVAGGSDLRLRLKGAVSDPWGLGSRAVLQTNQRTLHAEMSVQAVSQGMAVPEIHFALRSGEQAKGLQIQWPSGWVSDVSAPLSGPVVTVTEPVLFELSARWSPGGVKPVEVTVYQLDASGKPAPGLANCSIELAPGAQGSWFGDTKCGLGSCTRTWEAGGLFPGGVDRIVLQCGTAPWKIKPAIYY